MDAATTLLDLRLGVIRRLWHRSVQDRMSVSRRVWVRNYFLARQEYGNRILEEMFQDGLQHDMQANFLRMKKIDFDYLLSIIGPRIQRQDKHLRLAITAKERLAITIRYLATGDSYASLAALFRAAPSTISEIVPEVRDNIIKLLKKYIKLPNTAAEWRKIAEEFETRWNFPHVIGAIDGKHVQIIAPRHSGTEYYNYKGTYSIVLLAIVDANYNFIFADVGCQGKVSDGGVFINSPIKQKFESRALNIPEPEILRPCYSMRVPYALLGDKAFPLTEYCLRPFGGYPAERSHQRIFNARHSRARRVVENVFGILSNRFRVLRKPMELRPEKAEKVVMAAVCLYNFLRTRSSAESYSPSNMTDRNENNSIITGSWGSNHPTSAMLPLREIRSRSTRYMQEVRLHLAQDFAINNHLY